MAPQYVTPFGQHWVLPDADDSFCGLMLRKVGVPSMVFTIGFNRPPRSNSWADIFLQAKKDIKMQLNGCTEIVFWIIPTSRTNGASYEAN